MRVMGATACRLLGIAACAAAVVTCAPSAVEVAPARAAVAPLKLSTDGNGARLIARGRPARLVLVLTPARYRTIAGRKFELDCARVPPKTLGGGTSATITDGFPDLQHPSDGSQLIARAPHHRRPIMTRMRRRWDYCVLSVSFNAGPAQGTRALATIPLTHAGAGFVDERDVAFAVFAAVAAMHDRGPRALNLEQLAQRAHAVVLAAPSQSPPPGVLGLYTDHTAHFYAAQTDRTGKLLFLDQDNGITRTNLLLYLQHPELFWGAGVTP